jgi:hypothetical protein
MSRKIKLQPRYRQKGRKIKIVPELTLSGIWLEEMGFKAGQMVSVTCGNQELIIKPA